MGALWVVTANSIKNTNLRGLSQTLSTLNLRLLHEHLPLIFPSRNFAVEYSTALFARRRCWRSLRWRLWRNQRDFLLNAQPGTPQKFRNDWMR